MTNFISIPIIDENGDIATYTEGSGFEFPVSGVSVGQIHSFEELEEYSNKLRAAIEKIKKDRLDSKTAMLCLRVW